MDDFSLVPVDHQPEFDDFSLVPVEHNPFPGDGVTQQAQAQPQQATQTQPVPASDSQLAPSPIQSVRAQPQGQTQQPAMGESQPSASTLGVPATEPATSSFTAGADDFFKSIPRGIVSGFNNAASALGRATQAEMGQEVDAPTPEQGMAILEKEVTGPMHRPEGRAGKFGASVGEFLGNPSSYFAPGSLPFKVATAVLGGLGSEAGGQLGEGTPFEVPFRFAGGALGGALSGLSAARLGAGVRAAETALPAETLAAGRAAVAPDGKFYSVLFEHRLRPTSYPTPWRYKHNQEANEAFLQAMEADDAFARSMQDLGVNLRRTRTGLAPGRPPPGFTWHHAEEPGVMQLVPRVQHDPGSIFQAILHPGGRGGWSIWGKS